MNSLRILLVCALVVAWGCSSEKRTIAPARTASSDPVEKKKAIPLIYHQVRYDGESLALIAKWYTGSGKNWRALAEINPDVNPDKIFLDQIIRVPQSMAVQSEPYTLVELRRLERAVRGLPEMSQTDAPAESRRPVDRDVPYPEEGDPGIDPAPPRVLDDAKKSDDVARTAEEKKKERSKTVNVAAKGVDEESERRKELQEKTREELLKEMLGDKEGSAGADGAIPY